MKIYFDIITEAVSDHYDVSVEDLKGSSKAHRVAIPRHIAIYLCKELVYCRFKDLSSYFNRGNHTTALHSYNTAKDISDVYASVSNDIRMLKAACELKFQEL